MFELQRSTYSSLSVTAGSILFARHAGTIVAVIAAMASASAAMPTTCGAVGATP
jgi:hypothetical protein